MGQVNENCPNRLQSRDAPLAPEAATATLLSLVVPTRNELANVRALLSRLREVLAGVQSEILIVDDSDDGTPEEAKRAAADLSVNVRVIHREGSERRGGLSTAVIAGVGASRGEYICVMDADLQHPPQLVKVMLQVARDRHADLVMASRYVRGGSDGGLSSSLRRLLSKASKWLVKLLFFPRLMKVTDPLTGFFVVRRSLLEGVTLSPIGFKILLEILIRSGWKNSIDVPLKFDRRAAGKSKATVKQGTDFLRHAFTLFWDARVRRLAPRRRQS